jgi:hypothetical protein
VDEDLRGDVEGVRVISDQRNDLALAVTDPFDPPQIVYDPHALLHVLKPDSLACGDRLMAVLSNPQQLRVIVPDFPFKWTTR